MRRVTRLLGGAIAAMLAVPMVMAGGPGKGAGPFTAADFAAVLTNHDNAGTPVGADLAAQ